MTCMCAVCHMNDDYLCSSILCCYVLYMPCSCLCVQPETIQELKGVSEISNHISGDFFNTQDIFEPWNDDEKWDDVEDIVGFSPKYPASIESVENQTTQTAREYLGLPPPAEVDSKGKKGAKTTAAGSPGGFNDDAVTEEGVPLPRVHVSRQEAGKDLLRFRRQWTLQQVAVQAQLQAEDEAKAQALLDTEQNATHEENSEEEKKDTESTVIGNDNNNDIVATVTDMTLNIPPPVVDITEPAGPEGDPLMCAAFRLVAQYARSFSSPSPTVQEGEGEGKEKENESANGKEKEKGGAGPVPFLWGAIYPQLPDGTPCYNPAGKYCVKMFVGEWRANEEGVRVLAT